MRGYAMLNAHGCRRRLPARKGNTRSISLAWAIAGGWLLLCGPAGSLTGGVPVADQTLARHTVQVFGKHGMCTGVLLSPALILTAAHCAVHMGADMHVNAKPAVNAIDVAVHPQYARDAWSSPDLALVKLSRPLDAAPAFVNTQPVATGASLFIAGYGLGEKGKRATAGTLRMAMLTVSSTAENILTLADPDHADMMTLDAGGQVGVCQGDSGAPAFTIRAGVAAVAGIVTAGNRCRGITYVIPLAPYLGWIRETARNWGVEIESR